jgi:hypothetical protein
VRVLVSTVHEHSRRMRAEQEFSEVAPPADDWTSPIIQL